MGGGVGTTSVCMSPRRRDVAVALALTASPVRVAPLWSPLFLAHIVNVVATATRKGGISAGTCGDYTSDRSVAEEEVEVEDPPGTFLRRRRRETFGGNAVGRRRTRKSLCGVLDACDWSLDPRKQSVLLIGNLSRRRFQLYFEYALLNRGDGRFKSVEAFKRESAASFYVRVKQASI